MSNTLRAWMAGLGLVLSVLIFTLGSAPRDLGPRLLPFLLVLFVHAWAIVVAERIGSDRGGVEIKRFPLGPRLLKARPALIVQFILFLALFGVTTGDWRAAGIGLIIVTVVSVDVLRKMMPFVLPALAAVYALLNMSEFHTLGDLVETAKTWGVSLMWLVVWCVLLSGTLLRTDVGPKLTTKGKFVAALAGIPTYVAAIFIFTRPDAPESLVAWPDLYAIGLVLLAGGLVQSIVMTALSNASGLHERLPSEMPAVNGHDVGLALMPMILPIVAGLAVTRLPLGDPVNATVLPETWLGLLCLVLVVPALAAAGLVGAALDRADGTSQARWPTVLALGAFAGWFVGGPAALGWFYAPEGPAEVLSGIFPLADRGSAAVAGVADQPSLAGPVLSGTLTLYTTPVVDLMRAVTLMLLASSGLSVRLLRHARTGLRGPRWRLFVVGAAVLAAGCWFLLPALGIVGMPLSVTLACVVMLIVDQLSGTVEVVVEDRVMAFETADDEYDIPEEPDASSGIEDEQTPDFELGFDPGILEVPTEVLVDGDVPDPDDIESVYSDDLLDDLDLGEY